MENMFQTNLKKLTSMYSQKYIAQKTGFSQSSINNYITKNSEPSVQFIVALKNAFGIDADEFLFGDFNLVSDISYDKYIGNFLVYYYNNDSYKGEVHSALKNTLNYGVISIIKEKELDKEVSVLATFVKEKAKAIKILKQCNENLDYNSIYQIYAESNNKYEGSIMVNDQSIFLELSNKESKDKSFIILNNPPTNSKYLGGVGTVNSVSRGREHNPCAQYIIISRRILDIPDGELYNVLNFDDYNINLDSNIKDIIDLFKRLFVENNSLSSELSDSQKKAIIKNKLELIFAEILSANSFRFAKISNREDDSIYRLIKDGENV